MKTETLIHNLAKECEPVKPLGNPLVRFLKWAVATLVILAAGVFILRPDVSPSVSITPTFLLTTAVMVGVSLTAALSAFIWTVPDIKSRKFYLILATALASWLVLITYLFFTADLSNTHPGPLCVKRIIMLSVLPSILLFYMLRKAAPLKPGMVGLLASLGVLLFSNLSVEFVCPNAVTLPAHVLVWHILPVCILSVLGFFLGRLVFKWNHLW
jgi:hypothetical protein